VKRIFLFSVILLISAEKTCSTFSNVEYITISKLCQSQLIKKYEKQSKYSPYGIDLDNYKSHRKDLNNRKIIIIIERDSYSYHKQVYETFKIVES